MANSVLWFDDIDREQVAVVGGKNASLGEMTRNLAAKGVPIPPGFATTADAYWRFIEHNTLTETIRGALSDWEAGKKSLAEIGRMIRSAIVHGDWPPESAEAILGAYRELGKRTGETDTAVAVRSSATAEDLPDASFAGQQESYLNIAGEAAVLDACRRCYASLFTDRAISYRKAKDFDHMKIALSVGVQKMVRADKGGAGVMFSIDTETGFDSVVLITGAWGLGETVVQGAVDPDEYQVFKPLLSDPALSPIIERRLGAKDRKMIYAGSGDPASDGKPTRTVPTSEAERRRYVLNDDEIVALARWACIIEDHYGMPMDMEWAREGRGGPLYIVQARPETVQSRRGAEVLKSYSLDNRGETLATGLSIGDQIVTGRVCLIRDVKEIDRFVEGSVLVTDTTDPDWVPIMKKAAAIVTDHGGRTSHAAIVSRELGLPAIVGTGNATKLLHDQQDVTVCCAEGDVGTVYEGFGDISVEEIAIGDIPATKTRVMLNIGNPAAAMRWWRLPADGVGLARMEFVVSNAIKAHPMALIHPEQVDKEARSAIADLIAGYESGAEYFVDRLSKGLSRIAAVAYPNPVIVRMSDFKTNEYANLLGGAGFEPHEENPMLGFRGASRYDSDRYREGFALECQAIRRLRTDMGFTNVVVMIPFCRTPEEADGVLRVMAENGLERGRDGLQVYMMCEIPSNVIRAEEFARRFDGFSIGSNDLTQLVLGVDRDSDALSGVFDERDPAVTWMIERAIKGAHKAGIKIGLCGQAPSDHPEFAAFLVACGIDSISVTPDSFVSVKRIVADAEGQSSA
ncbi:phosphoenolpyruvate synthase [Fodinicurvata sp. EGI_FJ10296]|uniref:phosphoenolpyruvate synthase n=1 Tax=Fodinicurvata sp. EGI_FJ10296 TaxID=3231908 RepID=UPI003454CF81